jgi:hypothetical protein
MKSGFAKPTLLNKVKYPKIQSARKPKRDYINLFSIQIVKTDFENSFSEKTERGIWEFNWQSKFK